MKTLVVSHVTLVINYLVVTVGLVRVMAAGMVIRSYAEEVISVLCMFILQLFNNKCC